MGGLQGPGRHCQNFSGHHCSSWYGVLSGQNDIIGIPPIKPIVYRALLFSLGHCQPLQATQL